MTAFTVDEALCAGHGLCYRSSPDVFQEGPDGYNADTGRTVQLEAADVDEAREGAQLCPEQAIRLFDDLSG